MTQPIFRDDYSEDAVCQFRAFIDQATRHRDLIPEISEVEYNKIIFDVNETFDLVVISEEKNFSGISSSSHDDIMIENDHDEYEKACSHLALLESTDEDILQECINEIAGFKFAQFQQQEKNKILIHSNQRSVVHHFGCHVCAQSGMNPCSSCGATCSCVCSSCGGHGEISCLQCSGAGYRIEVHSYRDSDGHYRHQEVIMGCTCNNGWNRCNSCSGSGEVACTSCNDGYVDCSHCDASGWFSKKYTVGLWANYAISSREGKNGNEVKCNGLSAQFINAMGYQALIDHHARWLRSEVLADRTNLRIDVRHSFSAPSSTFFANLEFMGQSQQSTIAFFGHQLYLLDAGSSLDLVLKKDIVQLTDMTSHVSAILENQLEQKTIVTIEVLLMSPLLVLILDSHITNRKKSIQQLAQDAHMSLSTHEVEAMLNGFKRAFYMLDTQRILKILPILFALCSLPYCLTYAYFNWLSDTSMSNVMRFRGKSSIVQVCTFLTGCTLSFLMVWVHERRYRRRLKKTFGEKYLLIQRINNTYYSRIIYAIFILIVSLIFGVVLYT